MPSPHRPRKAYRPRQAPLVNPVHRAMTGVRLLEASDVQGQINLARRALAELGRGHDVMQHWRSLADTDNMAESLAALGIGSGADAQRVISTAQRALADIAGRLQHSSTRALYHHEVDALQWLISLHATQLQACSYAEFERAFLNTRQRLQQARAGNAPRDAVVVIGDMA